jgi:hypothetical protein
MANGFIDEKGYRKIAISFPPEVFRKVNSRAHAARKPFTTMAVELIKCGLYDYEESEKHEPATRRANGL